MKIIIKSPKLAYPQVAIDLETIMNNDQIKDIIRRSLLRYSIIYEDITLE